MRHLKVLLYIIGSEHGHCLMLPDLHGVYIPLFGKQSRIDYIIYQSLFFKKLFVVEEIVGREYPFEKAPPLKLVLGVLYHLFLLLAEVWDLAQRDLLLS